MPRVPFADGASPDLAQLAKLVDEASSGYIAYMRIDHGHVALLNRTGLDWTEQYLSIADALRSLPVESAYPGGELTGVRSDRTTSFALIQDATETGIGLFGLLCLDGSMWSQRCC